MMSFLKNKKANKRIKRTALLLFFIGLLFLHFYVPRIITEIKNPFISVDVSSNSFENGKAIEYSSNDDLTLKGHLTYSQQYTAKGTIILVHGIRGNKEHFINLSEKLAQEGYNSVAIDLRAHGESGGVHCTFGVREKEDISALLDYLKVSENINENVGIWGQSLGGAVSLQAMGIDERIKYGIIESTFTDFKKITNDYFAYHLGFSFEFLTNYLVYRAGTIAEFNPDEACPNNSCKNITQPILLVHGNKDAKIDIKYGRKNFETIKSAQKEFVEIDGGTHLNVWEIGGNQYFDKALTFIKNNTVE